MRRLTVLLMVVALAMVMLVPAASAGGNDNSFVASLKGRTQVPPFDTNGERTAHVRVARDDSVSYKLIVANPPRACWSDAPIAYFRSGPLTSPLQTQIDTVAQNGVASSTEHHSRNRLRGSHAPPSSLRFTCASPQPGSAYPANMGGPAAAPS